MRRRRRLFTVCSAFSLLLCIATLALRQWTFRDQEGPPPYPTHLRTTYYWGGGVTVAQLYDAPGPHDLARGTDYDWWFLGFYMRGVDVGRPGYARYWGVRLSYPAAFFGALAALSALPALLGRRGDARRRSRGLCPACGYDLRATPWRCPECGAGAAAAGAPT